MTGHVTLVPLGTMLERSGVPAFHAGCRWFETRLPLQHPLRAHLRLPRPGVGRSGDLAYVLACGYGPPERVSSIGLASTMTHSAFATTMTTLPRA